MAEKKSKKICEHCGEDISLIKRKESHGLYLTECPYCGYIDCIIKND